MVMHPISVTAYCRLTESPPDDEILLAFRLAYVEAQTKFQEKRAAHPGDATGELGVTLAVVFGQEVDCQTAHGLGQVFDPKYGQRGPE
jgi:hypothetical protein